MRIVSQDRTMSFNFDNIALRVEESWIFLHEDINVKPTILGKYGSGERAAEVFEDIHKV